MLAQRLEVLAKSTPCKVNSSPAGNLDEHALNVRLLWFRSAVEREEPAMLALDLLGRERLDDALGVAMHALAETPRDPELVLVAGRVHLARGETERARGRFIAAARLSTGWAEPFAWLARLLSGEGRKEKAAEVAERAVLLGCTDEDIRTLDVPRRAARVLEARRQSFLADPERDDPALLVLALEAAGRLEPALEVLDRALEREPDDEDLGLLRQRLRGIEPGRTAVDLVAAEDALDDEAREEAFFRSLGISTRPVVDPDEPSVIVSDTLLGELAPRVDDPPAAASSAAPAESSAADSSPEDEASAIPLVQLAPSRGRRSGWLPQLAGRGESHRPRATVLVAPQASVARRDPTVRFWLGR
jgi:tetratricopeptide (TPR) repeat protein